MKNKYFMVGIVGVVAIVAIFGLLYTDSPDRVVVPASDTADEPEEPVDNTVGQSWRDTWRYQTPFYNRDNPGDGGGDYECLGNFDENPCPLGEAVDYDYQCSGYGSGYGCSDDGNRMEGNACSGGHGVKCLNTNETVTEYGSLSLHETANFADLDAMVTLKKIIRRATGEPIGAVYSVSEFGPTGVTVNLTEGETEQVLDMTMKQLNVSHNWSAFKLQGYTTEMCDDHKVSFTCEYSLS